MAKQKKYAQEFKEEAVMLVIEQGYSYSQVARDVGCSIASIRYWIFKFQVKLGKSVMTPAGEQMQECVKGIRG